MDGAVGYKRTMGLRGEEVISRPCLSTYLALPFCHYPIYKPLKNTHKGVFFFYKWLIPHDVNQHFTFIHSFLSSHLICSLRKSSPLKRAASPALSRLSEGIGGEGQLDGPSLHRASSPHTKCRHLVSTLNHTKSAFSNTEGGHRVWSGVHVSLLITVVCREGERAFLKGFGSWCAGNQSSSLNRSEGLFKKCGWNRFVWMGGEAVLHRTGLSSA